MNPYVSITLRTFTIWIMAAVINGALCGIYMSVTKDNSEPVIPLIIITFFISVFFAAPGFFVFWIIMLIMIARKIYARALFRIALSAVIILACITGVLATQTLLEYVNFPIAVLILISAIASVMMHFNLFKKIGAEKPNYIIINKN